MIEQRLSRLIVGIYDAALDPELWPKFYQEFSETVSSTFVGIQVHDFNLRHSHFLSSFGAVRSVDEYHSYYARLNIWRDRGKRLYTTGRVVLAQEHTPDEVWLKSEFYNEFLRPSRITQCMAGVLHREPERSVNFTASRTSKQGLYDEQDQKLTSELIPHLQRALLLHRRLETLAAGEEVLSQAQEGIIFLSARRYVLFANKMAEAMFRDGDAFYVRDNVLHCTDPVSDSELSGAIRLSAAPGNSFECPEALLIPRDSQSRPYQMVIAPIRKRLNQFEGYETPAVVVLITDPGATPVAPAQILKQLYGLTSKEAEIVQRIAHGARLQDIAVEMEISYETVRSHLRRVYSKTSTTRQAELIRLVGSFHSLNG